MISTSARPAGMERRLSLQAAPYGHLAASERYLHRTRDEALFALLRRHGLESLTGLRILELGCGEGALLRSLLHYGADPARLTALDREPGKLRAARRVTSRVAGADIAALPYRDGAFDLAFAFTLFSSVLDAAQRRRGAAEALRVLRPGGLLVVYDFWTNPANRQVRPLPERGLRSLFAPQHVEVERVTLAPPIVRLLGGRETLCRPLDRLPWLRTHLLAGIVREA
jgi:ubiquinone/menaquinone biosynthesis C-methylase UbiE